MEKVTAFSLPDRDQINLLASAPFIYGMIFPILLLHLSVWLYQAVCFPIYGIAPVDSKKYIRDVRAKLPYLNLFQKLNCLYCSYANGVLNYAREVGKETEKKWCPIKNQQSKAEFDLEHRKDFAEYGDPQALEEYKKDNNTLL